MNSIALNHVYNAFMLDTITKPPYLYTWKLYVHLVKRIL